MTRGVLGALALGHWRLTARPAVALDPAIARHVDLREPHRDEGQREARMAKGEVRKAGACSGLNAFFTDFAAQSY